jgi:signal transduction histidine kinase
MLRKGFILLLFSLNCSTAYPQTEDAAVLQVRQRIAQMQQRLKRLSSDTARINLLLQLYNSYININDDSAWLILGNTEALSSEITYHYGVIKTLQLKGSFYETQHKNYAAALSYYKRAMALAKVKNIYDLTQELYSNHLNLYFYNGEFINAMKFASEALTLSEQHKDVARTAKYYNVIGFIHLRQNNAVAAENFYTQFLSYSKKLNDSTAIADALVCLGETMLLQEACIKALKYFQQAQTVFILLNKQNKLISRDRLPFVLFKIANAYSCHGDIKTALVYSKKALDQSKHIPCNRYDIAQYYSYTGNLYRQTKSFTVAAKLLHTGLSISKHINHKENTRDAYLYFHQLFAAKKEYDSAYYYYSLYEALKDSIINESAKKEIEQIGANYQLEKKNNEIKLLSQQKRLQEERIKQQALLRNLIIIFAVFIIMSVLFLTNRNHLKKKNKLQQEINKRQAELFNMTASIQDNERKRIAQDLHDGIGSLLSAAKLKLSSVQQRTPVAETLHLIDDATAELRSISHNLMPATLSKLGLIAALQNMIDRLNSKETKINLIIHGIDERLQEEMEIFTYRIISELMNNVVKHSNSTEATIQVIKYPTAINITIEDNGIGFDTNEQQHKGIGLTNIRSRVEYLKGTMHIDSSTGKGTTVVIDIPC